MGSHNRAGREGGQQEHGAFPPGPLPVRSLEQVVPYLNAIASLKV